MKTSILNTYIYPLSVAILFVSWFMWVGQQKESVYTRDDATTSAFRILTKGSEWALVDVIKTDFMTYHTQGLVKIGDIFYLSAVEIIERTSVFGTSDNLWDFRETRTAGKGRGWLFKFNKEGKLLDKIELASGDAYHPGGIDYDGVSLWIPVSEYRPNSLTRVYRVDPETMHAEIAFTVKDHLGAIVHNTTRDTFHAISWDSRRMYEWKIKFDDDGHGVIQSEKWRPNPQHLIGYQDCQYVGVEYMLCGGFGEYQTPVGRIHFGGIDLIDLSGEQPLLVHQIPVTEYIDNRDDATVETFFPEDPGLIATHNAFWVEAVHEKPEKIHGRKLIRLYSMAEKNRRASLIVYELSFP